MALHTSIHYSGDQLFCDDVAVSSIVATVGTPVYIYSLKRAVTNYQRIAKAFADLPAHIHYSAKANANLTILKTLIQAGAGIDAVSAGEIYRALAAGAVGENIVFAGVGKTPDEISYALDHQVGWFNVENIAELELINALASGKGIKQVRIALRLNPEVTAATHPYIATGHGGAKFGLTADMIQHILNHSADYPHLDFAGLHIHIGSQLRNTEGTISAIEKARAIIAPYPSIKTLNIGGGFPAAYQPDEDLPDITAFAEAITPHVSGYNLLLEPGRSIIADAGILIGKVLYTKQQAGQLFYITDMSMTDLIRPALYQAYHHLIPVKYTDQTAQSVQIVGPVCETADVIGRDVPMTPLHAGDYIAALTAGAYGMVMASNYNARPRPAEVAVNTDGHTWQVIRRRETMADLVHLEQ